jgi:hypothetical protein
MHGETPLSILRRLIDPGQGDLSPAAAAAVLQFSFTEADQTRLGELAALSSAGRLSAEDAAEYDAYIAADDFLSLWKSKARLSLKRHNSAA